MWGPVGDNPKACKTPGRLPPYPAPQPRPTPPSEPTPRRLPAKPGTVPDNLSGTQRVPSSPGMATKAVRSVPAGQARLRCGLRGTYAGLNRPSLTSSSHRDPSRQY